MGVTVAYRGRLDDFSRLEALEDAVIDLAIALGGRATIWRTTSDTDLNRWVRGVIWDLAPGSESVALLFSPEGWLVPLHAIEDAEEGRLEERPWVFVKTQFAAPDPCPTDRHAPARRGRSAPKRGEPGGREVGRGHRSSRRDRTSCIRRPPRGGAIGSVRASQNGRGARCPRDSSPTGPKELEGRGLHECARGSPRGAGRRPRRRR